MPGIKSTYANSMLNAYVGRTTFSATSGVWLKLHVGDPGAAGTSNPAGNTVRAQATFGAAASSGAISTTSDSSWSGVSTSETYTHVSAWDASSNGNFLGSAALSTPETVNAGDNFTLAAGRFSLSIATVV